MRAQRPFPSAVTDVLVTEAHACDANGMRDGFVYTMAKEMDGTHYVGVTSNITRRTEKCRLGVA